MENTSPFEKLQAQSKPQPTYKQILHAQDAATVWRIKLLPSMHNVLAEMARAQMRMMGEGGKKAKKVLHLKTTTSSDI